MTAIGERERQTQNDVVRFFRSELDYRYLGDWHDRSNNRCMDEELLHEWLTWWGYDGNRISKVLRELDKAATISGSRTLYEANRAVYELLRYGVHIKPSVDAQTETVWLIDWEAPSNNDFAIAEEVTVEGPNTKRPDVVLYVNGIALGVLELKRSTVSVTEGIRQNRDSQKPEFIQPFFATIQLMMAGNPTEGLRYGVIDTPQKHWLRWQEDSTIENPLFRELDQLCRKPRLLEIIHDFIVFDAGIKKTCRYNQYFGVQAAQANVREHRGGIIWHTQGSGKSLTMVWLAKWIREHVDNARVLLITDRTELDEQIEQVFKGVDEDIYRTESGSDLVNVLNESQHWLIGSLIHKFGRGDEVGEKDIRQFVDEIKENLPRGFHAKGDMFVFVDECHRSQSGKLHEAMKALLPDATLIGFTGTPLLKKDKQKSIEVFGPYIHTYKFDQAVHDGVVLDLRYEARDIDQELTSQDKINQWFELKTQGLTDLARAQLKQRWGTLRKVMSSRDRLARIVDDILLDMAKNDRLMSGHGNAMLVSDSVHAACRLFEMFQQTELAGHCAIVTSYRPQVADIKGEDAGEGATDKLFKYQIYRRMLAEYFNEAEDSAMNKAQRFEQEVKERFIKQPGQMKLLIVVDKLLTGFDAPPATYLYIDKKMQDHGLFQAICRVNRLHTEDKEYGFIIDYKDLFRSLEGAISDYTGEAFDGYDAEDVKGLLKDRLEQGSERLEEVREQVKALCEPVSPPYETQDYLHYFIGSSAQPEIQKDNEPKRLKLYKLVASYLRAYANLANEMSAAGYTPAQADTIRAEVTHYEHVRNEVKLASGDYVDLKMYEPAMRHLLDNYIRSDDSRTLSAFDDMSLVDLLVDRGAAEATEALPKSVQSNEEAMAETIENNVRKVIIDEMAVNPKYYEHMSELLDTLIEQRREDALDYEAYLEKITGLARQTVRPETATRYPQTINNPARQALFDTLKVVDDLTDKIKARGVGDDSADPAESVALSVDDAIRRVKKDGWRGNRFKEKEVRKAIRSTLDDTTLVDELFELAKNQRDY